MVPVTLQVISEVIVVVLSNKEEVELSIKKIGQRGMNLIELMIALGLTSGLVVMDLERQRGAQVTAQRQLASESQGELESMLKDWLRRENVIANSFGRGATPVRVYAADGTPPTIAAREADAALDDAFAIGAIRLAVGADELISQRSIGGVTLIGMGPASDTSDSDNLEAIRRDSIDGNGLVFIRAMWIQDFQPYAEIDVDDGGDVGILSGSVGGTVSRQMGSANLKVLTWKFSESSQLNCLTGNNCERQVFTLPLELRLQEGIGGDMEAHDGNFGIQCEALRTINVETSPNCDDGDFFRLRQWVDTDASAVFSVGRHTGQCCRFVQ